MSLKIIKAGILDTLQDKGRFGFQNSGINAGGAMDQFSARLANALIGKEASLPVIEIHFPGPVIEFEKATIICITGADFRPVIDNIPIQINQPVIVNRNSILEFKKVRNGARCYLAVLQDFSLTNWLNSYSTNLKAEAGGYEGRALKRGDVIQYSEIGVLSKCLDRKNHIVLPFKAEPFWETATEHIEVTPGTEWNWLTDAGQNLFLSNSFNISTVADRMGYRLKGISLQVKKQTQLISTAVSFGTIQLLPNGQLIILMADHQTTGGYPKIAHVISAHLPALSQRKPNEAVHFKMVDIETAEQKILKQHHYLVTVQHAAAFKLEKILQ